MIEKDKNLLIKPYFNDMITVLKSSDIAVSRAGSLSLSEICACSIASILIPYPYAAADHQRKNAKSLLNKNACLYLEDSETNSENLFAKIEEFWPFGPSFFFLSNRILASFFIFMHAKVRPTFMAIFSFTLYIHSDGSYVYVLGTNGWFAILSKILLKVRSGGEGLFLIGMAMVKYG